MLHIADFHVQSKNERDDKLNAAIAAARKISPGNGNRGILVTRHNFSHFSVALSPDVPFGLIVEHDNARRN
jgi:hypothetical protein